MDMYEKSLKMFLEENKVEKENTLVVLKLHYQIYVPMVKLTNAISWTEPLCSLGQTVMISNFQEYYKVVEYFANYTKARMGLAMGVNNLVDIFDEKLSPFKWRNLGALEIILPRYEGFIQCLMRMETSLPQKI
jgi:hypothetical protein